MLRSYDLSVDDWTYVCLWSKTQIDDCDRYKSAECPLEKHDVQIRADTIDECIKVISEADVDIEPSADILIKAMEQLKEQNK